MLLKPCDVETKIEIGTATNLVFVADWRKTKWACRLSSTRTSESGGGIYRAVVDWFAS